MKSAYLSNALLEHNFDGTAFTQPTAYMALYTAYSGDDPSTWTEVSAGGYSRVDVSGSFASASSESAASNADISFGPSSASWGTVGGWAMLDASSGGNILYYGYLTAALKLFTALASDDTLYAPAHGLSDDDTVVVQDASDYALPTGLTQGTIYYVINGTTDTLQLSTSQGGSAINLTASGVGYIGEIATQSVTASNITLTISSGSLTLIEA